MDGQEKIPDRVTGKLDDKSFDLSLGRNFRTLRRGAGVSVGTLSKVLRVSAQQIQKYESGQNRFPLSKLLTATRYLGYPMEVFLQSLTASEKETTPCGSTTHRYLHQEHKEHKEHQEHCAALTKLAEDIEQLAKHARNIVNEFNCNPKNQP